jgi:hypothetical protein
MSVRSIAFGAHHGIGNRVCILFICARIEQGFTREKKYTF